jgi:trk system potassium uptake protein TrkH
VGSFLGLIGAGTVGLMVLPGLYTGEPLSWIDALFTATSAVCVTGLVVVNTATHFTFWGEAYLLLLIQLGGLGILTFTTLIILALGRRLSLHHQATAAAQAELVPEIDFRNLVRNVVLFTLVIEAVGAVARAVWHAIFQSVSAFCNAGFSSFPDSLMSFQTSPLTLVTIAALIVLGGLGFLTLEELHLGWNRSPGRRLRLSLHSRLVLATTAVLIVAGWLVCTSLEWSNTLAGLPPLDRIVNGLFMSVTARTAGFNSVDYASTTPGTNFFTILLMSVGGSPGSTAGGIKTTTLAVLALLAYAKLRGRGFTGTRTRSLPEETIHRAIGLVVVAFSVVTLGILILAVTELGPSAVGHGQAGFFGYMFEAVSAFNTVGLSMGVTPHLSTTGRLVGVALMYVGRVGPLSVAAAISLEDVVRSGGFRFAYEDVIIG